MFGRRSAPAGGNTYRMRQQMMSIGDDYWIEDAAGQRVFQVDGKAMSVHHTMIVRSLDGRELFRMQKPLVSVRDTIEIHNATTKVATVKKAMVSLRDKFEIAFESGAKWTAEGKLGDHEYHIDGPAGRIGEVSKKWFRVRDSYGISIAPGQDDAFVLMVTVAIDQLSRR